MKAERGLGSRRGLHRSHVGSFDQVNLREWEKVQLGRQTEAASRDPEWHARKPVCAGTEAPFFLN